MSIDFETEVKTYLPLIINGVTLHEDLACEVIVSGSTSWNWIIKKIQINGVDGTISILHGDRSGLIHELVLWRALEQEARRSSEVKEAYEEAFYEARPPLKTATIDRRLYL